MKSKANAKLKREADVRKRKAQWSPKKEKPAVAAIDPVISGTAAIRAKDLPQQSPEEETREFLEYLERYKGPVQKDEGPFSAKRKNKAGSAIGKLNLEDGMPFVEEAVQRLTIGLQEMKVSGIRVVKLIHGYGSTGRGGKICAGVRKKLSDMKHKKLIREFIPGEDFGPMDAASRKLAEQDPKIPRDPDYGRLNHGITIVVL